LGQDNQDLGANIHGYYINVMISVLGNCLARMDIPYLC